MTTATQSKEVSAQPKTLKQMLADVNVKGRFEQILGDKAAGFISSIISEANGKKDLSECEPSSVIAAAAIAASLDLPIVGALGFAALVPYKDKTGKKVAQFQIMVKGWIQLGQRTGQYKHMNAFEVFEGQLVSSNEITGVYEFSVQAKKSDKVIGYGFYFQLLNGFEKYIYMTVEQCQAHGKRYSKSYDSEYGKWKQEFPVMASKTVVKKGFKWGPVQIDTPLGKAMVFDQAKINEDGSPEYIDATATPKKEEKTYALPEGKTEGQKSEEKEIIFTFDHAAQTDVDGEIVKVITGANKEKLYVRETAYALVDQAAEIRGSVMGRYITENKLKWLISVDGVKA